MTKRFQLVELELSGKMTTLYSFMDLQTNKTLFDNFIEENQNKFIGEIKDLIMRLNTIAHKTGGQENFFKLREGKPGDGVAAIYDLPAKKLRLYCIRYSDTILVLGGGGPKNVRALQDDPKLHYEQSLLVDLAKQINERIKNREIFYSKNYKKFLAEEENAFFFDINI